MATFTIPKRVTPQKKTLEETIDALSVPFFLKACLSDEFKSMDGIFEYQHKGALNKLLELQAQIEKLQCEINVKRDSLRVKKEILAQQDQETYIAAMKEIEAAFLEQKSHLHMEIKCTCVHRTVKSEAPAKFFMCAVIQTVVKELEEQGYLPECQTKTLCHGVYNAEHIIDCEL